MSWDSPFLLLRAAKGTENGYLRASVLRRGTFGAKVPKTWGPFPWSPTPTGDQRERFSLWKPFRQSGADWESRKRQYGDFERAEFAPNFSIFFKNMRKKQPFSV